MVDWLSVLLRGVLFLVALLLVTKLLGKKQLSELSFFEYVSGITIGSIAAEVIMGLENNIWHGLLGIAVFAFIPFLFEILSLHSKKIRDFVEGKGTVIIKEGKILEKKLKKEKYTIDELLQLLREKDVFNINEVEYATLEADGKLSVLLKKENRPVTGKDLGLNQSNEKETFTVIMDGEFQDQQLAAAGKTRAWVEGELNQLGMPVDNIFLCQIDSHGQFAVDVYDDKIQIPSPQEKPLLLASLKKCQADFELFALAARDKDAKKIYEKNAQKLQVSLDKLTPLLKS
ncbi:DUF421 domain-containing protein [Halobacillus sp. Marseille-Q1614]|uniref:DUF421 domain-containing protein n=1 Tax=Halobacillus sp. Marseille-Q1614 TaxID=2709134 RepID=UPI00156F17A2|nr:DUF421 domain-containing protein [Halobacillus sp. Marseille-Q1614]